MRFFACEADNWGNNDFPIGERGYAVLVIDNGQCGTVKWFPSALFEKTFGSIRDVNESEEEV